MIATAWIGRSLGVTGAFGKGGEGDGDGLPAGVDALQGLALVGVILGPMVEIDRFPLFDLLDEIGEEVLGGARWGWGLGFHGLRLDRSWESTQYHC